MIRVTFIDVFGFLSNDIRVVGGAEQVAKQGGQEIITGLKSYFNHLSYNYDDRYLLTSTVRQDKFSRFVKDFLMSIFPSLFLGWRISNESFFPEDGIINNLKLRVSYGELGSGLFKVLR